MVYIDQIIQRDPNPFDAETFWSGNFWQEEQDPNLTVVSIHRDVVVEIQEWLNQVAIDNRTRTLMLEGETGSGKSYLLGRLKRIFNCKAFFVYIEPFTASDYIWRHILRYTVDSLLEIPSGYNESQLLLWLRGLSAFENRNFIDLFRGERQAFIRNISANYPAGIYNAAEFFGVLYDLTNPKLYRLACEWLRGDDLDEESLKLLKVQNAIETEDAAQKMLANFGRISAETVPIVLCFDQLDNIARSPEGHIDLQTLFSVNSIIHNQKLKNFLIIISIITDTWRQNLHRIQPTDKDRIDANIKLKQITIDQAEELWISRLYPLHKQAYPLPSTNLYPLSRQILEENFPGGKTKPRNVLMLGRQVFQDHKIGLVRNHSVSINQEEPTILQAELVTDSLAAFKLVWLRKFSQIQERIIRVRQLASPELIQMLAEALAALQVQGIQPRLLPSRTYASYSISYLQKGQESQRIGIVWTEDLNMTKFCNLMKSCQEMLDENLCQNLYLIRYEGVGTSSNMGYKLYGQIFQDSPHHHIMPDMTSVHYLATYHSLVNDAYSGDLVVGDRTPDLKELENLMRKSMVLRDCRLLQDLGIFPATTTTQETETDWRSSVQDFLVNRIINQKCIARQRLTQEAISQFSQAEESEVHQIILQLCQETHNFHVHNPEAKPEEQLIVVTADK